MRWRFGLFESYWEQNDIPHVEFFSVALSIRLWENTSDDTKFPQTSPVMKTNMPVHYKSACFIFGLQICVVWLKLSDGPYYMSVNSKGTGKTVILRRLTWTFAGFLCNKYTFHVLPQMLLTLLLLNSACPVLTKTVDPDQLAFVEANWSGFSEANWSGSALFGIN